MNRKKFILTISAGALTVLHHPAKGNGEAHPNKKEIPNSIAAKAVVPACLTPIDPNGQVDYDDFKRHISQLSKVNGVSAIMVNGGAGHDKTLTRDEKRELLKQALEVVGNRTAIIAAVRESEICPSLGPLAEDAQSEGAHAIAMMPPASSEGFSWAVANQRFNEVRTVSSLPLVIYQTRYETDTLIRLANEHPVIAVKEGSKDPFTFERNMRALHALDKDVAVWSTHSRWLLADLATGADGILSGMGSVAADLQSALLEAIDRSDLEAARQINDRIFPLVKGFYVPGQDSHIRMKYALKRLGRQKTDLVRPPLEPLNDKDRTEIDRALIQSGIL